MIIDSLSRTQLKYGKTPPKVDDQVASGVNTSR